jgi:hypothetical protein
MKKQRDLLMKKGFLFFLSTVILVFLAGCGQSIVSQNSVTLPNGYVPTEREMEQIKSLSKEAEGIKSTIGSRGLDSMSGKEQVDLIQSYVSLLKGQFGEEYKKFFLVREASNTVDAGTLQIIDSQPAVFVDPDWALTSRSIKPKLEGTAYPDAGNGYCIKVYAQQWWTPWCAWNTVSTTFYVLIGSTLTELSASTVYAGIYDWTGSADRTLYNQSYVQVSGVGYYAFMPQNFSCTTYSRVTYPYIANGDTGVVSYSWF